MSKRESAFYLVDILIACNKIERYTKPYRDADALKWSEQAWDATLRELEIVGEATNRLISQGVLDNSEYRKIVDFRNVIIHGYFGIDEDEVFYVVREKLPQFCEELKILIAQNHIDISKAVAYAKEENAKHEVLVAYLDGLLNDH